MFFFLLHCHSKRLCLYMNGIDDALFLWTLLALSCCARCCTWMWNHNLCIYKPNDFAIELNELREWWKGWTHWKKKTEDLVWYFAFFVTISLTYFNRDCSRASRSKVSLKNRFRCVTTTNLIKHLKNIIEFSRTKCIVELCSPSFFESIVIRVSPCAKFHSQFQLFII